MSYQAEYIWIDGVKPTAGIRCKTKILADGEQPGIWGFDGSSTNQAPGDHSDCVLQPVLTVPDPIRGGKNVLVLCEVLLVDMTPHPSNTRAACKAIAERYKADEAIFGIEQEYTLMKNGRPFGWPEHGFPAPQGPYYCGVGDQMAGREIIERHTAACIEAGLHIEGTNAEVMKSQWEFQIGAIGAPAIGDEIWIARYLLRRIAEDYGVDPSLDAKPMPGDWNGAGAHTNFSTKAMREGYAPIIAACKALEKRVTDHIENYGHGIKDRLTGAHETAHWSEFSYGASDRGASVRIPWHVERAQKGYIEDRRPNANADPYVVARLMLETICGAAAEQG